ncbi:MAG TPA: hypothetical protein VFX59_24975 [Polyangiales bacterium]|nr:hypothetical protein [Polyangiales bacterium]
MIASVTASEQRDLVRDLMQVLCARALELGAESFAAVVDRVPDLPTAAQACTRLRHALQASSPVLLRWRVVLLDQLRFELGEEGYEAARLDEAARQLWRWLEGESLPSSALFRR